MPPKQTQSLSLQESIKCPKCDGNGYTLDRRNTGFYTKWQRHICTMCRGRKALTAADIEHALRTTQ